MPPELLEVVKTLGPFSITIIVAWWLMGRHDKQIEKKDAALKEAITEFKTALATVTSEHKEAFKQMAASQEKRDAAYESLADKKIIAILELGAKVETLQTAFRDFKQEMSALKGTKS